MVHIIWLRHCKPRIFYSASCLKYSFKAPILNIALTCSIEKISYKRSATYLSQYDPFYSTLLIIQT